MFQVETMELKIGGIALGGISTFTFQRNEAETGFLFFDIFFEFREVHIISNEIF